MEGTTFNTINEEENSVINSNDDIEQNNTNKITKCETFRQSFIVYFKSLNICHNMSKTLLYGLVPFIASILILILMSIYREYIGTVDKMFASNVILINDGVRSYNETSVQKFFSDYLALGIVLEFVVLGIILICLGCGKIFREEKLNKNFSLYLQFIFPIAINFIVHAIINSTLKISYMRPRPYQTEEFGLQKVSPECYYPFIYSFDSSHRSEVKDIKCYSDFDVSSFPSGHVGFLSQSLLATTILMHIFFEFLLETYKYKNNTSQPIQFNKNKKLLIFYKALHIILVSLLFAMYLTLSALMCSARITAGKHFFSDVISGFVFSLMCSISFIYLIASPKLLLEKCFSNFAISIPC